MQINKLAVKRPVILTVLVLCLAGCGGTKILKEPEPLTVMQALAESSDRNLSATLDWVIVRDGPGTWAKNADWDEYLIRVRNLGDESLRITNIDLLDSLGTQVASGDDRRQLVKGSKQAERRYKGEGLTVQAGAGAGTLIVASAATAATAVGVATAASFGSTAMAGAAVGGLVLAPVLAVGGIVRGVNNSKVNNRIETRLTPLPVVLQQGDEKTLDIFFPLTPSPRQVELTYVDSQGEHVIIVDTRSVLDGLHLAEPGE